MLFSVSFFLAPFVLAGMAYSFIKAAVATTLVAFLTAFDEFGGKVLIAAGTVDGAFVTQCVARAETIRPLIVADGCATGCAGEALPFFQRDISTARVVRVQDLRNDLEEIVKPAFTKRPANRENPLAFAKAVVADMRMRHVLIVRGGIGFQGDHGITKRVFSAAPVQFDAERAEVDLLQQNRLGNH